MTEPKEGEGGVDETGADDEERDAKEELFEAIDHFKNAASILFSRATKDPAVKTATKEAERVVKQIGGAAEPLAKELTKEVGRLTRDVLGALEGARKKVDERLQDDEEE
ncbi:MAG: hypothetical protein H6719_00850 [Sandaracinaceae bacterium]|nr:hypothetical protein [Sandaracinaceae bacterium]